MAVSEGTELLTIAEAAQVLKVSTVTIHRWIKDGRLPAYRIGPRAIRIRRTELARLLHPAGGSGVSQVPEVKPLPGDLAVAPPGPDQIERRLGAMREATALRDEMRQRRGGKSAASSWRLIRQAREARSKRR